MPIKIEAHTVPHFKAPVICNGIVKLGGLVNKMGFDKTVVPMTVDHTRLNPRQYGGQGIHLILVGIVILK